MLNVFEITDKELLMDIIGELVETNEFKLLRKLIKNNQTVQSFTPKELNMKFPINGYRFTTKGKVLVLTREYYYKPGKQVNTRFLEIINHVSNKKQV